MPDNIKKASEEFMEDLFEAVSQDPAYYLECVGGKGHCGTGGGGKGGTSSKAQEIISGIPNADLAKEVRGNEKYNKIIESLAKEEGLTKQQYIDKVESHLKERLEQTPVAIRVDQTVLSKVLDDGRFKNQFETGKSGAAEKK